MPIQTGGFGVQVMPQVNMPDPRVMAFDPTRITAGIGQAVQLSEQIAKVKAFKAAQQEEDAIRQLRIAATNAQNLGVSRLTPKQVDRDVAKIDAEMPNIAPAGALAGAQIASTQKDLGFKEATRSQTEATTVAKLTAEQIASQNAAKNAELKAEAETQEIKNNYAKLVAAGERLPKEIQIEMASLDDRLKNATSDAERARLKEAAQIRLIDAQAANLNDSITSGSKAFALFQKAEAVSSQYIQREKNMWNEQVQLPDGTMGKLSDYWEATRNPEGTDKEKGMLFWKSKVKHVPESEKRLDAVKDIQRKYMNLQQKIANMDISSDNGAVTESGKSDTFSFNGKDYKIPTSKAEYDALPDGASWVDSTGKAWTKGPAKK